MKISKTGFVCMRANLRIRGHVFKSEMPGKLPAIIVSHGFLSNQQSVWGYAQTLAELGYAAFAFDFCGGCVKGTSDGKSEDMTILTEAQDLNAVIDYVKTLPYVQSDRISLMGCSQGGFVSGIVAANRPDEIEKLILFYPALCIPDDARAGRMLGFKFDPNNMSPILSKFPMKIGREYAATMLQVDPFQEIQGYTGPVLIVHGTDDNVVKLSYAREAQKAYGEDRCELLEIHGAGHGFKKNADAVAINAAKEFMQDREEVLSIDVNLTGRKLVRKGLYSKLTLPFSGNAESKWFEGVVEPGASDVQERKGLKTTQFKADYVLSGKDCTGTPCKIHIVNIDVGNGWKPTVSTDSRTLAFLNSSDCTAYLEQRKCGPIVHIYTQIPKNFKK